MMREINSKWFTTMIMLEPTQGGGETQFTPPQLRYWVHYSTLQYVKLYNNTVLQYSTVQYSTEDFL